MTFFLQAKKLLLQDTSLNHEYLMIDGIRSFTDASARLILGENSTIIKEKRYCAIQTISGTGAVRLGADILHEFRKEGTHVYISNPTWGNHEAIFKKAGFASVLKYEYWDPETRGLNWDSMMKTFRVCFYFLKIFLDL